MTLGPVGTVTQALSNATPQSAPASARRDVEFFMGLYPFRLRFSYRGGRGEFSGTTFSQPLAQVGTCG
jgi:hypothetical protein